MNVKVFYSKQDSKTARPFPQREELSATIPSLACSTLAIYIHVPYTATDVARKFPNFDISTTMPELTNDASWKSGEAPVRPYM